MLCAHKIRFELFLFVSLVPLCKAAKADLLTGNRSWEYSYSALASVKNDCSAVLRLATLSRHIKAPSEHGSEEDCVRAGEDDMNWTCCDRFGQLCDTSECDNCCLIKERFKVYPRSATERIFIEIGGNVGADAHHFLSLGPHEAYLFEPVHTLAKKLKWNLRNFTNVKVINKGVGEMPRYTSFNVDLARHR